MVDLAIYKKNIESYIFSVNLLKTMQNKGILDKNDFAVAEKSIAKKYGIKTTSIYVNSKIRITKLVQITITNNGNI